MKKKSLMQINKVADPVLVFFFFTPGWGKNPDPGSGMNLPDHFQRAKRQFLGQKILKFFDADPRSGNFLVRDRKILQINMFFLYSYGKRTRSSCRRRGKPSN